MENILFSTNHLVMRRFNRSDINFFLKYRNDPDIMKYQSWENKLTTEEGIDFIQKHRAKEIGTLNEWMQIAIENKNTSHLIGDCAFRQFSPYQGEFGITIAKKFQGNNYGFEAIQGLFDFVFNKLNLHRMTSLVDVNNIASIKLQERLGMRKEAHFVKSFYYKNRDKWEDEFQFAILKDEWKKYSDIIPKA